MSEHGLIAHVLSFCAAAGYALSPLLVVDYVVALKSSPFVLLFGPSGQGKTELARLFAQALVAPFDDQYTYVSMGSGSDDETYIRLQDRFGWLKFVETLENAGAPANASRAFFLCLDDLRPSDVATYFARLVEDEEGEYRLAFRGQAPSHWPIVPPNVIITGTLDADQPIGAEQSALLAQVNCVYMQPHWLQSGAGDIGSHRRIAPSGFQRMLLDDAMRGDEAATARLRGLLGDELDEALQLPAELSAVLWQAGMPYDQAWRGAMLRRVANSFTGDGRGLFVPGSASENAQFAYVFALARQMLLRLWGHKAREQAIEAFLRQHIDNLPPITVTGLGDTLIY